MQDNKYHNHHILPKHMGGLNNKDNLVRVTIEEHALLHYELYLQYGKKADYLAYCMLSGKDECIEKLRKEVAIEAFKEWVSKPENKIPWRKKISDASKGKVQSKETKEKRKETTENTRKVKGSFVTDKMRKACSKNGTRTFSLYKDELAEARRKSEKWKESVSSPECVYKKRIGSKTRVEIVVNGVFYNSQNEFLKTYNIKRYRLKEFEVSENQYIISEEKLKKLGEERLDRTIFVNGIEYTSSVALKKATGLLISMLKKYQISKNEYEVPEEQIKGGLSGTFNNC